MSNTKLRYTAAQVIAAVKGTGGIKQAIADRLGVDRHTIDRYLDRYPAAKQAYDDENERVNDYNETVLNWQLHETQSATDAEGNTIKEPTAAAVDIARWRAPRKMKERGYTETLLLDLDPTKLTLEQLERIHNGEDIMTVIGSGSPAAMPAQTPTPPKPQPKPKRKPKSKRNNAH